MNNESKILNTRAIAKAAVLGAVAFVLMLLEFPLPIAPSFYKMDFSEAAVLMGGFALGPAYAVIIEALKVALNLIFQGTITMGVGEMANFLIGISFTVPAAYMYSRNKTLKTAIKGMAVGTLCMMAAGVLLNYFVLLPAYVALAHFPMEAIIGAGQAIFPFIQNKFTFVMACVTPFNLIKGILISVVTRLLYKRLSPILHA
ncbi:MAG: ECF transporter S component [Solobacterium sp.]|nr:ECF transporter S component [Solobacterium sp.]